MANWFLIQEGKEHGPVQSGRLRELVATGQLCPTDLVRRDDMAKYCRADQIKGLFPSSASAVATSNQQPDAQPRQHGDTNSVHTQQPSADLAPPSRATPRWEQILLGLWRTTADASRLTALQVEKTKLHSITLQRAFAALGRHLDDASTSAPSGDEFSMLRTQIRDLKARIEATRSVAANQPASQGVLDKAKGMAKATADAANRKKLELQLAELHANLGKAAFERLGEAAGPVDILRPIIEGSSRVKQIDDEQAKLESASSGRLITPRRVAMGVCAVIVLAVSLSVVAVVRTPKDNRSADSNGKDVTDAFFDEYPDSSTSPQFVGKRIRVAGTVVSGVQESGGGYKIDMDTSFRGVRASCSFQGKYAKEAEASKAKSLTIVGVLDESSTPGRLELSDCRLSANQSTVNTQPTVDGFIKMLKQSAERMGQENGKPIYRFRTKYDLSISLGEPTSKVSSISNRRGSHEILEYRCKDGIVLLTVTYDLAGAWIKDIQSKRGR